MAAVHFILPGDPATKTGGYLYDARIIRGLRELCWRVDVHALGAGFPSPDTVELAHAQVVLANIPNGSVVVVDGLALGGMPELIRSETGRLDFVALIHHPLAVETGLSEPVCDRLYHDEQAALALAARIIVTSSSTARLLQQTYGVVPARLGVVMPGTDRVPLARGSGSSRLHLLCVASLIPRKGHHILFEALADLRDRAWQLVCVGSLTRDPATVSALQQQVRALGLHDRIEFVGELAQAELADYYAQADVFVLPSYLEGYGMALAEALAHGLPVVSTTGGAIPETVPPSAGLLVPPGDSSALRAALSRILDDAALRQRLASGARAARESLPTWDVACTQFAEELTKVITP